MKKILLTLSLLLSLNLGLAACSAPVEEKKETASESTQVEKMKLQVDETNIKTDENGIFKITGKATPNAIVSIDQPAKKVTADADGKFELEGQIPSEKSHEVKILAQKDSLEELEKSLTITPHDQYVQKVLAKKEQEEKEIRAKAEAVQTADSLIAKAKASLNPTDLAKARTYINENQYLAIQGYSAQLTQINDAITAKQDQIAQDKAKKAEEDRKQAERKPSRGNTIPSQGNNQQPPAPDKNQQTVLITATGSKYHARKCGNGTYYTATLAEAKSKNLSPCSKCY
ncbi:extracellular serine protease [Listeria fleischmannii subsp. coloradonensis]|uniref:Serine protease n=1 Tax=Listeria fleischmannii TaxID=1069827 RepID=A0A841YB27_9LIST|nr:hypothetical protein [Listeria fleischmannii]EIA19998.1 extracellular serine protease [Listeria fleischmannii subsp. coloradonensis]MBC1397397.1 serine protease [Listeria fleischmannii]MBC1425766.1 serine protease [Listeria fleischmannii]